MRRVYSHGGADIHQHEEDGREDLQDDHAALSAHDMQHADVQRDHCREKQSSRLVIDAYVHGLHGVSVTSGTHVPPLPSS